VYTYTTVVLFTPLALYVIVSSFLPSELVEGGVKPAGASAKIVVVVVVLETVLITVTTVKAVKVPEAVIWRHRNWLTWPSSLQRASGPQTLEVVVPACLASKA
jgi:hypothetical protein